MGKSHAVPTCCINKRYGIGDSEAISQYNQDRVDCFHHLQSIRQDSITDSKRELMKWCIMNNCRKTYSIIAKTVQLLKSNTLQWEMDWNSQSKTIMIKEISCDLSSVSIWRVWCRWWQRGSGWFILIFPQFWILICGFQSDWNFNNNKFYLWAPSDIFSNIILLWRLSISVHFISF